MESHESQERAWRSALFSHVVVLLLVNKHEFFFSLICSIIWLIEQHLKENNLHREFWLITCCRSLWSSAQCSVCFFFVFFSRVKLSAVAYLVRVALQEESSVTLNTMDSTESFVLVGRGPTMGPAQLEINHGHWDILLPWFAQYSLVTGSGDTYTLTLLLYCTPLFMLYSLSSYQTNSWWTQCTNRSWRYI